MSVLVALITVLITGAVCYNWGYRKGWRQGRAREFTRLCVGFLLTQPVLRHNVEPQEANKPRMS